MKRILSWPFFAVLYACAIFVGSSIPAQRLPEIIFHVWDKLLHVGEYSVLAFLVERAFRSLKRPGLIVRYTFFAAAVTAMVFGASDEVHQLFVPGRSAEVADWIADSIGALCGAGMSAFVVQRLLVRMKSRTA